MKKIVLLLIISLFLTACGGKSYTLDDVVTLKVKNKENITESHGQIIVDLDSDSTLKIYLGYYDTEETFAERKRNYKYAYPKQIADYEIDSKKGFYVNYNDEAIIAEVPINNKKYLQVYYETVDKNLRENFLKKDVQEIIKNIEIK